MDKGQEKNGSGEGVEAKAKVATPLFLVRKRDTEANIVKSDGRYPAIIDGAKTGPRKGE